MSVPSDIREIRKKQHLATTMPEIKVPPESKSESKTTPKETEKHIDVQDIIQEEIEEETVKEEIVQDNILTLTDIASGRNLKIEGFNDECMNCCLRKDMFVVGMCLYCKHQEILQLSTVAASWTQQMECNVCRWISGHKIWKCSAKSCQADIEFWTVCGMVS